MPSPASLRCVATQLHSRKKKAMAAVVAFFVELRCNCIAKGRRRWQLPSPSSWSCATAELHSRKKKVTAAVVAFFMELCCS